MKKGICCAGYMCIDSHYFVNEMPKKSELAHIVPPVENATGGVVCNTGLDIAILDPAKVTRSALQNATSVASTLLTTEAVVGSIKEAQPAMPQGGMPGMM